jgi:gliding motility-associatede transport system auxiliary component
MRRSASLFGLLGLVFLVFGFLGLFLIADPLRDPRVLIDLVAGGGLVLAYLAFGFDDFRALLGQRSTRYGASAAIYSLLFLALVLGANYLSYRHHKRWDVTEAGIYTLAPQSVKVVRGLAQDLTMTAFVEGGQDAQLESLFESYKYAAPSHVSFRLVDPDQEPGLAEQMKITALRSVNLQYGPESFVVTNPTEESITNGVIRISGGQKRIVYFVEGHGEADLQNAQDPNGYSEAKLGLEQENYDVKTLLLPAAEQIPADASAVVVGGPQRPLGDREVEVLDAYLKRGGHLFVMVGPRQPQERLAQMLQQWGVRLGNDIVIDREVRLFEGPRLGVVPLTRTYGTHPITENFHDFTMFPQTRSVEPAVEGKKGLSAAALVKTSASSWAETDVDDVFTKNTAAIDDGDRQGPVTVAVAVTAKLADLGLTPASTGEAKAPDEARLVVVGSPLFAGNQQIAQMRLNGDLFLNAVGWLVGQEELVSIRSRSVRASRAELTPRQQGQLFYLSVLLVPQLMIAAGIAVWWWRKSR